MAEYTLIQTEKLDTLKSPKPLQCRFHDTEEYQIFCKDCKDFMCFKCLGQLHQKHDLSPLQDAEEDIRTEMKALLFRNKYDEQLNSLNDQVLDKEKELVKDEESLKLDIRTSVEEMKENIDLAEKRLLSVLRNEIKSYRISLQEQKTNINNLKTEIGKFDRNELPEYNLNHIIYSLSEMKLCFSTSDTIINHPKPGFQPTMEFSIGHLIETSSRKCDADALLLHSSSNISTQTDFSEDSDSEWFDAEDIEEDDVIESSSDEITNEYPINFQMNQDINFVKKIVPISEKDAWIIANRKLLKIVDYSMQVGVYADKVDDIVALKDGCVLVLRYDESFIMKLLPNRRLVRFSNVDTVNNYPNCICIRDDIIVIYLWNAKVKFQNCVY
ncbi:unnamed protein product [Mytilus edulis]|uniref:B box-type domain-containing protein n=1 Tax=Mytilus edulis TaxID=6550 RepID=A0A8S3UTR5_MYTED|nr:unnamed protein product [Mytilus edulis]